MLTGDTSIVVALLASSLCGSFYYAWLAGPIQDWFAGGEELQGDR
jgi:hypothetical protein